MRAPRSLAPQRRATTPFGPEEPNLKTWNLRATQKVIYAYCIRRAHLARGRHLVLASISALHARYSSREPRPACFQGMGAVPHGTHRCHAETSMRLPAKRDLAPAKPWAGRHRPVEAPAASPKAPTRPSRTYQKAVTTTAPMMSQSMSFCASHTSPWLPRNAVPASPPSLTA